jgi:hypothetical protein
MATGIASGNGEMAMLMPLIMGIQGGSGGAEEETLEALLEFHSLSYGDQRS